MSKHHTFLMGPGERCSRVLKEHFRKRVPKRSHFLGGYHSQTLWILLDWNSSLHFSCEDQTELGVTKEILIGSWGPTMQNHAKPIGACHTEILSLGPPKFVRTSYEFRWFLSHPLYICLPESSKNLKFDTVGESTGMSMVLSKWVITPI